MIRRLHRLVWQRLPREARRRLLFSATHLLAPRARPGVAASEPVIVAGYLSTASGLGQSARLVHDALKGAGLDVRGIDLSPALMQPSDLTGYTFSLPEASPGPGTVLLFVNAPLVPMALMRMPRRVTAGKRVIGYWAWELERVPGDWRAGCQHVHEIWAPSTFSAAAFEEIAGGQPVEVVLLPVAAGRDAAPRTGAPAADHPFTVLTAFNMASSFARKNPLATVEAFKLAFGADPAARLIVRSINTDVYPPGLAALRHAIGTAPNIELQTDVLSPRALANLYDSVDAFMSLHRSEGFGLGIAEAMLHGLPTIATGWSGSLDFHTAESGFHIGFDLVPAGDPQGEYDHPDLRWAEARVQDAAERLKQLAADPQLRERLGQRARADVRRLLGEEAFVGRLTGLLGLSAAGRPR
jgi:glycosyltransferase involved in cell wall biosynthesis